jgi:RNase P/RNase MRP subunit POP5
MPSNKLRRRRKPSLTSICLTLVLGASSIKATQDVFQEVLDAALTGLYGIIGGALVWELIDFQKDKQTAIVRCYQADQQRICAAAAFMTQFKGLPCRLQVLQTSPALLQQSSMDQDGAKDL